MEGEINRPSTHSKPADNEEEYIKPKLGWIVLTCINHKFNSRVNRNGTLSQTVESSVKNPNAAGQKSNESCDAGEKIMSTTKEKIPPNVSRNAKLARKTSDAMKASPNNAIVVFAVFTRPNR
ncbi:MAG: hypothetical protein ABSD77_07145 [Verrucomicrobiota bacterium]|jgi:hypothetical protein